MQRVLWVIGRKRMVKLVISMSILLLLAGCKETIVEDNSPDRYERESAMRDCVGQYIIQNAPFLVRLVCTQAIYGEK
jgi:hypothetical protein